MKVDQEGRPERTADATSLRHWIWAGVMGTALASVSLMWVPFWLSLLLFASMGCALVAIHKWLPRWAERLNAAGETKTAMIWYIAVTAAAIVVSAHDSPVRAAGTITACIGFAIGGAVGSLLRPRKKAAANGRLRGGAQ